MKRNPGQSHTGAWMLALAALALGATAATADNTVQTTVESIDCVVGRRQSNALAFGYHEDTTAEAGLVGITGSAISPNFNRRCQTTVIGLELPALPPGKVVLDATLTYEINRSRTHDGFNYDAHVYLLHTANPGESGTSLYYHGPGDPNKLVAFVGGTSIPFGGNNANVTHDPPVPGSNALPRGAVQILQGFYDNGTPTQPEAFFRFNRSLDYATITINNMPRYFIIPGSVTLEITYGDPPPQSDIQAAVQSKDSIVGQREASGPALGYYTDITASSTVIGTSGATGSKTDRVAVVGFTLPALPAESVVLGATLGYKITQYRNQSGDNHSADVYLLDTAHPDSTGIAYYYNGPGDTSADVAFVGRKVLSEAGTAEVFYAPPINVSHTLAGNANTLFQSFYDGPAPTQTEAFFRLNRSNTRAITHYDRYFISLADEDLVLVIHYVPPRGTVIAVR